MVLFFQMIRPIDCLAQIGSALDIVGSGDYVTLPPSISTSSFVGGNKVTLEAWVKPNSLSPGGHAIVSNYLTPANQMQFLLSRANNYFDFFVGTGVGAVYSGLGSAAGTATAGIWQHVAGVYDGTVMTTYVNGVVSTTNTASYTFANTTNSLVIGMNVSNQNWDGELDEIRIWNVARTKCQINTYMNCEIPAGTPGLVANYHFNQGIAGAANPTVTSLIDASGNAFTGTLTGFALNGATSNWVAPGGVVSGYTTAIAAPNFTSSSLQICLGNTVVLGGTGGNIYTWSGGITNSLAFTPTNSASFIFNGTNTVTSCTNTAVANLTVNANPTITVNSGAICTGGIFTITPGGASTYTIQGGNAVVSPTVNTTYTVIGTSSFGCVSQNAATSSLTVNPNPTITVNSGTICSGGVFTITPGGASTYIIAGGSAVVSPTVNTNYTILGVSSVGCISQNAATSSVYVAVCTGINEHNGVFAELSIYPNPYTETFTIDLPISADVLIRSSLGEIIYYEKLIAGKTQINMQNYASGVYFVEISNSENKINYKVIKQ